MALPFSSTPLLTASSTPLQPYSKMVLRINSPSLTGFKDGSCYNTKSSVLNFKPCRVNRIASTKIFCAMSKSAGESGEPQKLNLETLTIKARKLWDSSPQPVKSFPWEMAFANFVQLILDLTLAVIKSLCLPVFAITSLSEMSYCGHEKKLYLIPLPLLLGVAVAGVLKETALELSPLLKDAEVPWHLIVVAIFFTVIKLPGPYYPYWGRIFLPHFANGGLLRTLWFAFLWYKRPRKLSGPTRQDDANGSLPEETEV